MRLAVKLVMALGVTSLTVFGSSFTVTFNGPDLSPNEPSASSSFPTYEGACASVSTPGCIITGGGISNPIAFDPVSATITETAPGQWTYTEVTYTPNQLSEAGGTFPAGAFGDALFEDTSTKTYWGLALDTTYDGLTTPGGLYYEGTNYANAYLLPSAVGASGGADPVLLAAVNNSGAGLPGLASSSNTFNVVTNACYDSNGNLLGSSASACVNPIALNPTGWSEYTITDTFTVGAGYNFIGTNPDSFDFEVASYICSNGVILGAVPEPRGVVFMGAALLLLAGCIKRLRTKTA